MNPIKIAWNILRTTWTQLLRASLYEHIALVKLSFRIVFPPQCSFKNYNVWTSIYVIEKLSPCFKWYCQYITWQSSAISICENFHLSVVLNLFRYRFNFLYLKFNFPELCGSPAIREVSSMLRPSERLKAIMFFCTWLTHHLTFKSIRHGAVRL